MKILQVNSVCGIGSTGRICIDIAGILEKQGHQCKIAYGRNTVPDRYEKYAVRIGNSLSVKWHALKARVCDNAGFESKRATEKFLKWVDEYNPDIIHLHNLHGYYINVKLLFEYLKEKDIPVIWTLHDCWPFTGHCTYFEYEGCTKWMDDGCYNCGQKDQYPKSLCQDRSQINYQLKKQLFTGIKNMQIVTPSLWLSNLVKKSFLNEYKINVIHNGIDLEVFKTTNSNFRCRYGLENKKIILGVASGWDERKGLKDLIKLLDYCEDCYRIVIVGLNEKQKKMLPEKVLGILRTNDAKELAEIYTAADVFVNPTYEDNYPTTNLEALACGTPVITYKTGGSPESITDSNGVIVDRGDVKAIYETILKITNGKIYLKPASLKELDKNTAYSKYVKLYEENI